MHAVSRSSCVAGPDRMAGPSPTATVPGLGGHDLVAASRRLPLLFHHAFNLETYLSRWNALHSASAW